MIQTEKNFYKFSGSEWFKDGARGFITPGPGMYESISFPPG